jgi:hypothetical protein
MAWMAAGCSMAGMADLLYGGGGSSAQPEPCIKEDVE